MKRDLQDWPQKNAKNAEKQETKGFFEFFAFLCGNSRVLQEALPIWDWRLLGGLCAGLLALGVQAQPYAVDWAATGGGGGTSTGGAYAVSGTVGQADAGEMSGGSFTVTGGFWSVTAAAQTAGAPALTVARTTAYTIVLSWPSSATGFVLQQNPKLAGASWSDAGLTPADDGTTKSVVVPSNVGTRFYRLKK
jgi:hypothetical protein